MNDVRKWIINWFVKNGNMNSEEVESKFDCNYIETGMIDSFGFIQLVADIEEQLEITLTDDDFGNDKIFVISDLVQIIQDRM